LFVVDSPDEKRQPMVIVRAGIRIGPRRAKKYLMPTHAHLMVRDGDERTRAMFWRRFRRETTKTKDITAVLPRVVELFEARKASETAVIAEINGAVKYGEVTKGQRKIYVVGDDGEQRGILATARCAYQRAGRRAGQGRRAADGWAAQPHDIWTCS